MSKKKIDKHEIFETAAVDINGLTHKEWKQIEAVAIELKSDGYFKGNPFKCCIAGFVLWLSEEALHTAPDNGMH